jgi:hypothetical protein
MGRDNKSITSAGWGQNKIYICSAISVMNCTEPVKVNESSSYGVLPIVLLGVKDLGEGQSHSYTSNLQTHLPPRSRKDVLAPIVPTPLNNFTRMRLILLDGCVGEHTHIVMHIEVEQGA